ncbi:MAG TPA: RiPP maturation radical SAM C-methyltransferase [Aggregatilinea sp.]|uniref:RiPP maturation radical SAM C-methyltransferase n=1 Tax=Aggregatilinea sp. TaxID=2806333 RepID=UPI002BF87A90|nr:RiPP maturation radical SAM C-methyltransferase [Aggregatilinea sp.]HML21378.1 RiPP maturation radical SAM C-methyltransferase [Aggregatilinea sp.]
MTHYDMHANRTDIPLTAAPVLLVSMPFGPISQPSIGLTLLKGVLAQEGIPANIFYATLLFAEMIGGSTYNHISSGNPYVDLAGEWVFANALFDGQNAMHSRFVDDVLRRQSPLNNRHAPVPESHIERLLSAVPHVEAFLDRAVEAVLDRQPRVVGITSTFQQHVASLCLAKRLKAASPDLFIVMGGGNCEGTMGVETVRQFPAVDAVVSGEGEHIFPDLVRLALDGDPVEHLQGVFTRRNIDLLVDRPPTAPPVTDMDALPLLDYDDFFEQLDGSTVLRPSNTRVLFETSRGCWWGERSHCTFCGLNGETMAYRSKSAERAVRELTSLLDRYPDLPVWVVDNIMDMRYFNDFIPMLADLDLDLELFYEVKANLRKSQLVLLRDAGIKNLQPGVESLNDHVLKLMKKGVSWLQNIQLLKWGEELGIDVYWNILWGFPGEDPADYEQMTALFPLLFHLNPPVSLAQIRLDRFSPHFNRAEADGFANVRPAIPYDYMYAGLDPQARANLAYHFFYDYQEPRDLDGYTKPLYRRAKAWRREHDQSALMVVDLTSHLLIWDLRSAAVQPLTVLTGWQRDLYLYCDEVRNARALDRFAQETGAAADDVRACLEAWSALGLVVGNGSSFLALGVRLGSYAPSLEVLLRLKETLSDLPVELDMQTVIDCPFLDDSFFSVNCDGDPCVYFGALCALINHAINDELARASHQTVGGITLDV